MIEIIETILRGIPKVASALLIVFGVICISIGGLLSLDWLWTYNRVLGILAMVTCVVVVFLIMSYLTGLDIGEKK